MLAGRAPELPAIYRYSFKAVGREIMDMRGREGKRVLGTEQEMQLSVSVLYFANNVAGFGVLEGLVYPE